MIKDLRNFCIVSYNLSILDQNHRRTCLYLMSKYRFDSLPKFTIICEISKVNVPIVIRFRPAKEFHAKISVLFERFKALFSSSLNVSIAKFFAMHHRFSQGLSHKGAVICTQILGLKRSMSIKCSSNHSVEGNIVLIILQFR